MWIPFSVHPLPIKAGTQKVVEYDLSIQKNLEVASLFIAIQSVARLSVSLPNTLRVSA
jgi:hypothetical protein